MILYYYLTWDDLTTQQARKKKAWLKFNPGLQPFTIFNLYLKDYYDQ